MGLNRAPVPEGIGLSGAPALRVRPVIPLEVRGGSAGMCIILPGRNQQMQVRLLAGASGSWDHERHR